MPVIKLENCTKCLRCVKDCPSNAIDIDTGTINDKCIHCGHCVAICPESTVFPDAGVIKKLTSNSLNPDYFQQLSAGIRTCRSYVEKEVEEEKLNLLIENMKHYPSASNARPIEITAVRTKESVQGLNDQTAQILIKSIRKFTSPLIMPILQLMAPKLDLPRLNNYNKQFIARNKPGSSLICHHAPLVLLFHAPVKKFGMADADANIWATYTSIYANTLGLGSCFNGFIVMAMKRSKSMRKEYQLPAGHQVYAALLIGHPKVKYTNEAGRTQPRVQVL
jgi:ferredoxin